ncbi:PREDICTED: tubulin polyglutamylase complex subunit 1 [Nanorana parkeri]|uniref:tubulin polyglutamylase complex subunit 1 n=1 Tax=Nanorana parkeri TaxID=125878 RepID=UPI0008542105|nr:PREDICTED: tubulin polyglutamylase complex subunit 1 [Nanorana parkeri]
MAERRRAAGSSPVPRPPPRQTSEADFLLQAGVRTMMREAILKLLEARPEDPVAFLADYFGKIGQGPAGAAAAADRGLQLLGQQRLGRALWYLKLAHHSQRTAFNNNLSMAYDCLSAGGKKKKPGLNGKTHTDLLTKICQEGDLPKEIVSALLNKIQCRDHEAVPFDVFRYGVVICFVLLEFRSKADTLFNILDEDSQSDQRVCQTVLNTLEEALVASDLSIPASYLEAGSKLGPDCLAIAMDRALLGKKTGVHMSRSDFLKEACSLFLDKVKQVS